MDKPFTWAPHEITNVEASVDAPRTGMVGRAAAMRVDGIECLVLCRTESDLDNLGNYLLRPMGKEFDLSSIYKATLIHSTGIEVAIPPVQPEVPVAPPLVPVVPPGTPVRGDDGEPVATYKEENDDEL